MPTNKKGTSSVYTIYRNINNTNNNNRNQKAPVVRRSRSTPAKAPEKR